MNEINKKNNENTSQLPIINNEIVKMYLDLTTIGYKKEKLTEIEFTKIKLTEFVRYLKHLGFINIENEPCLFFEKKNYNIKNNQMKFDSNILILNICLHINNIYDIVNTEITEIEKKKCIIYDTFSMFLLPHIVYKEKKQIDSIIKIYKEKYYIVIKGYDEFMIEIMNY